MEGQCLGGSRQIEMIALRNRQGKSKSGFIELVREL
jgi:hypothetical protein